MSKAKGEHTPAFKAQVALAAIRGDRTLFQVAAHYHQHVNLVAHWRKSIRSLPASQGAVPWFWHWDDRRYAVWWDSEGLPFVQGPNLLFTHSGSPRIDREEYGWLNAVICRAMFCHSDWYRDLIAKHHGPASTPPIVTWPYPIDPWPGEPLPDDYDLLIYAKNGHRLGLLEHLAETFPRHVQIHYGQYRREQLFEAARPSRACAYLADDDHGPLALQAILLAGCPVVGVRTGGPFVNEGTTGVQVERLPPSAKCVENDADAAALGVFVAGIQRGLEMKRDAVRASEAEAFGTDQIVDQVVAALERSRTYDSADRRGPQGPGAVQKRSNVVPVSTAAATWTRNGTSSSMTD